jgi:guanylate kinase
MGAEGIFFLVAGPTAAGKTTVLRRLVERAPELVKDVSVTTRAPRPGEVDGQAYRFWDRARFDGAQARGEFLEHAVVHGTDCYGTLKAPLEARLREGRDVIKDIDVQGAAQARRAWPYPRTVLIFLVPPSPRDLWERFRGRGTDDQAAWRRRIETARREVEQVGAYDYLVYNGAVEEAVADLLAVRRAEHLRRERGEEILRAEWLAGWDRLGASDTGAL